MEGCVYIISNKSLSTLKIGRTTRTAEKRARELDSSGIAHRFVAEYELRVKYKHEEFEKITHRLLSSKWNGADSNECFECDVEYAVNIIREAASEFNFIGEVFYWVDRAKENTQYEIPEAQTEVAYAYYKGYGVPQNYTQAKEWFEKAAIQGNAKAQNYLGLMYYRKQGIEINNLEKDLLDDALQQHDLEHLTISDEHIKLAQEWLKKSVEQNNAEAQFNLACMYFEGSWLAKDYKKSFELFTKSAEQGNINAQFYLGKMYQYGDWVKRDIKQAKYWYLKAIESDENILEKVIETCLGKNPF